MHQTGALPLLHSASMALVHTHRRLCMSACKAHLKAVKLHAEQASFAVGLMNHHLKHDTKSTAAMTSPGETVNH
jgi:hypothetical protein